MGAISVVSVGTIRIHVTAMASRGHVYKSRKDFFFFQALFPLLPK